MKEDFLKVNRPRMFDGRTPGEAHKTAHPRKSYKTNIYKGPIFGNIQTSIAIDDYLMCFNVSELCVADKSRSILLRKM